MTTVNRDRLVADINAVLGDVESLMRQAATAGGQQAGELRDRASAALRDAQQRLQTAQTEIDRRARAAAGAADDWVHENPWTAVGVGAGVGLLLGMLLSRR